VFTGYSVFPAPAIAQQLSTIAYGAWAPTRPGCQHGANKTNSSVYCCNAHPFTRNRIAVGHVTCRLRLESMHGKAHHVLGVRGSVAGSRSGLRQLQDSQPSTYRSSEAPTRRSAAGIPGSSPGNPTGFLLGFQASTAGGPTREGTRAGGQQREWDPLLKTAWSSVDGAAAASLRGSNVLTTAARGCAAACNGCC
jgi:hypothetical protein